MFCQWNDAIVSCSLQYFSCLCSELTPHYLAVTVLILQRVSSSLWGVRKSCRWIFKKRGPGVDSPWKSRLHCSQPTRTAGLGAHQHTHWKPEWLSALGITALAALGSSSADFPACLGTLSSSVSSLCVLYLETMRDSFKPCVPFSRRSSCHAPAHHCDLVNRSHSCHRSSHALS